MTAPVLADRLDVIEAWLNGIGRDGKLVSPTTGTDRIAEIRQQLTAIRSEHRS